MKHLLQAHKHSIRNAFELENSEDCGCFYCLHVFQSTEITEWITELETIFNQYALPFKTALCPKCGMDTVIGDSSRYPVTDVQFLREMQGYWFNKTVEVSID